MNDLNLAKLNLLLPKNAPPKVLTRDADIELRVSVHHLRVDREADKFIGNDARAETFSASCRSATIDYSNVEWTSFIPHRTT